MKLLLYHSDKLIINSSLPVKDYIPTGKKSYPKRNGIHYHKLS